MIDMVYKGTEQSEEQDKQEMPKNVRQIGDAEKGSRVYLEDYAVTYLHQVEMAVLVGQEKKQGEESYTFIQGAIEVAGETLDDGAWETIYREAKQHFEGCDILGWAMRVAEQPLTLTKEMDAIHRAHFNMEGAVLLLHEPCEKEDSLFVAENGMLKKQNGYFIYYDKNKAMQNYMVEKNEGKSVEKETQISDRAIRNFRKLTEEKRLKKEENTKKVNADGVVEGKAREKGVRKPMRMTRLAYAAGTLLILTVLVTGVTMLNNYDKIKSLEQTLATITEQAEVSSEANNATVVQVLESESDAEQAETAATEATTIEAPATEVAVEETNGNVTVEETAVESPQTEPKAATAENPQAENPQTEPEAAPATTPTTHTSQAVYVVKAGDTLADICKMYYGGTEQLDAICELNGIADKNTILLGQKIVLP